MADDDAPPPIRLMNFVSEDQLAEARKNRGLRVEDGTAQRDRPLFEILKENKDKKDAEFNECFKHRPPKALDEDETEFLDNLHTMRLCLLLLINFDAFDYPLQFKREYERQIAEEEERYLCNFQAAVESQYNVVRELKETPSAPKDQEKTCSVGGKKKPPSRPLGMVIKVKPQAKKAKMETPPRIQSDDKETSVAGRIIGKVDRAVATTGLVSYSDDDDSD